MSIKQDRGLVRTAQDLERKYDFSSLVTIKKNVELQQEALTKTNTTLEEYINVVAGIAPKVETAVSSVDVMYAQNDSTTVAPTSGWNTVAPQWQEGLYMWQKTVTTYADGHTETSTPTCISGAQGKDGTGVTILGSYETVEALKTAHPTGNLGDSYLVQGDLYVWSDTTNEWSNVGNIQGPKGEQGIPGTNGENGQTSYLHIKYSNDGGTTFTANNGETVGSYIGQYVDFLKDDSSSVSSYKWAKIEGDTGIGVRNIEEQYYLSTSKTSQTGGSWKTTQDAWTEGKYIWTRSKVTWTDDTVSYTTPVLANALNNANELANKAATKITTFYYSGTPTLTNMPASEWTTNELKAEHVNSLYYDKDTGYVYIYALNDSTYSWERVEDKDIIESLALANAAKDTADGKRRVFVATPEVPYDNGDLWVNNGEIYICQISKVEGEYAEGDFIVATKYTDDTYAKQVGDNLTVLEGTVLEVQKGVNEFRVQFDTTVKTIQNETKEHTEALETMSYSFGTKDLAIANSSDPVNARINNQGLKVYTYEKLETIVNHNGLGSNKLIVIGDTQTANIRIMKATDENGEACSDFHHLVSNIQSLEDLEV